VSSRSAPRTSTALNDASNRARRRLIPPSRERSELIHYPSSPTVRLMSRVRHEAGLMGLEPQATSSPNSRIAVSSTVRPSGGIGARACFAEVAGKSPRCLLAARSAATCKHTWLVRRVAERSPRPTPGSLLVGTSGVAFGATVGTRSRTAKRRRGLRPFRRRRTRRPRPPPSSRTGRSQWTARASLRRVVV
jgi:hypothetical protein